MSTEDLYSHRHKRVMLSFEVFPPRPGRGEETIFKTIMGLKNLSPDFVSVTYGTGPASDREATCRIAHNLVTVYDLPSVAHVAAVGQTRAQIAALLDNLQRIGVKNILALRGDVRPGMPPGDFAHADALIAFIRSRYAFNVLAACYPEIHPESPSVVADLQYLKRKVDAGVSQLITQLFFDNESFYRFRERCELVGIDVPISAGIMPAINKKQIERVVSLCGAKLPPKFTRMMARYEDKPECLRDAGIAYAMDQLVDLISNGVQGIHLYTMNRLEPAERIYAVVHRLLE